MTQISAARPALATEDTLDASTLVGRLGKNGEASLTAEQAFPLEEVEAALEHETSETGDSSLPTSDEEVEDYDAIAPDPDTLIDGSRRGVLDERRASSPIAVRNSTTAHLLDDDGQIRRQSEPSEGRPNGIARRRSIQIRLEKTGKKGRYILTADDPDIREILRKGIEREQAATDSAQRRTRFRDLVFTRQFTTFDRQNPLSAESPFHGFFTLFWLAMVGTFLKVAANNWRTYGSFLGNNEVMKIMFSKDVIVLGLTDIVMLLSTSFGLLLHQAVLRGYLTWARSGWIIQNIWQAFFLAAVIGWTLYRHWPWTHTIFMVLHTMVFLMKQHSYACYNGHLSGVYKRCNMLKLKKQQLKEIEPADSRPTSPTEASGLTASGIDLVADSSFSNEVTHRPSIGSRTATNLADEKSAVAKVAFAMESGQPLDVDQMQTFDRIIQDEIDGLEKELRGKSVSGDNAYPKNLNIVDFAEWTCFPTLVYELEYPRQDSINWWYVAEKTAATFGVIGVMMVISQAYIYPPVAETVRMKEAGMSLQESWAELPWVVSDMLFPLLLEQLLTWYVIWECILNVLAEVTRFADRGFYGDWWNSVSWDQYARDWNRPVHNFLLRHVYHSSISAFHLSKSSATLVTFLLSALVHELVMACLFKKVRGYLFTMQLLQLPLVSLSRTPLLKGRNLLGNVIFWIGLFVGPSVLTSLYLLL